MTQEVEWTNHDKSSHLHMYAHTECVDTGGSALSHHIHTGLKWSENRLYLTQRNRVEEERTTSSDNRTQHLPIRQWHISPLHQPDFRRLYECKGCQWPVKATGQFRKFFMTVEDEMGGKQWESGSPSWHSWCPRLSYGPRYSLGKGKTMPKGFLMLVGVFYAKQRPETAGWRWVTRTRSFNRFTLQQREQNNSFCINLVTKKLSK